MPNLYFFFKEHVMTCWTVRLLDSCSAAILRMVFGTADGLVAFVVGFAFN